MRERQDAVVDYRRKVFASFEDADKADARYDAALSSGERLNTLIELRDRRHPDAEELRRRILGPISSQTD